MPFSTTTTLFLTLSVVSAFPRQQRDNVPCYQDNPFRALQRFTSEASSFCPEYLASAGMALPSNFVQYGSRMTSACSCYEKTAGTVNPTSTATAASSPGAPVTLTTTPTTQTSRSSTVVQTMSTPTTMSVVSATSPVAIPASQSISLSVTLQSTTASVPSTMGTVASSSASTVPTYVATGGTAKRGLVYDYNSKSAYADFFTGSQYVNWGSNWGDTRATGNGVTIPNSFMFIPTLRADQYSNWNTVAKAAIASGSKYLFASNEPDNPGQANLNPQDTANIYKQYMQPFAGQALLATPAVTNGGGTTGLNFLSSFLDACAGCHFDMINIHHYLYRSDGNVDQAVSALKSYIENDVPALQAKHPSIQGLPIMIGEFWLWNASPTEGGTYLDSIMPYLDGKSNIIGYQAFGGLWTGNFITSDGTGLTPAGTAYKG